MIEDKAGFYIPEEVLAKISPALFLKYKMAMTDKVSTKEYQEFCDDIYDKTGLQIMLVYCHRLIRGMVGKPLKNELKAVTPKGHVWASPSFDPQKLINLKNKYYSDISFEEAGMFPFRWEPEKNDWE